MVMVKNVQTFGTRVQITVVESRILAFWTQQLLSPESGSTQRESDAQHH